MTILMRWIVVSTVMALLLVESRAAAECECRVDGVPTVLFRGALIERLSITTQGCGQPANGSWAELSAEPDLRIPFKVVTSSTSAWTLELHRIPQDLASTRRAWTVDAGIGMSCTLEIASDDGFVVAVDERGHPQLKVNYLPVGGAPNGSKPDERGMLMQLHSGASADGLAVTDPGNDGYIVENRVQVTVHQDLATLAENHRTAIKVAHSWEQTHPVPMPNIPDSIAFYTLLDQHAPLIAHVTVPGPSNVRLFAADVVVALGARVESLPLPLGEALFVACGDDNGIDPRLIGSVRRSDIDVAASGETRGIDEADLDSGACRLHYAPSRLMVPTGVVPFFGRQEVLVTVSRDGGGDASISWPILDPRVESYVVLPSLTSGSNGTGAYRVVATINGAKLRDIVYRPPSATNGTVADALSDHEFRAQLRPRGAFGWQSLPIRTFVTFPVEFVGFRFNARGRDLRASSDSTTAQITTPRLGVLMAVEPWNYDAGANPWPIPTRFMAGLHLFELSQGAVAPSMVVGASFTFPLIDLPKGKTQDQLGTDVAVGMFWEVDLQERKPFRDGNHFVVTLGLNVLSVFGAK